MNQLPPLTLPEQSGTGEMLDIGRLLRAVLRYRWGILGLTFAVTLATGLWVYSLESVYRASASVLLETREANVVNVEQVYQMGRQDYDYFMTQFELLKSRALAERVVRRLKLHQHPMFRPADKTEEEAGFSLRSLLPAREKAPPVQLTDEQREDRLIQSVTGLVMGGLSVPRVEFSYLAHLNFESTDPVLAAQIVNTLAEEFIESDLENRLSGTLQATGWLNTRLETLKENLRVSEQALQEFREQEGLVNIEGVTGHGRGELQALSARLDDARRARMEAENILEEVRGMGNASISELMSVPAVLEHQVIRDIKREQSLAERRVAELNKRYGVKHPKMIAARSDLSASTNELTQEVKKVVSGIGREYDLAQRNEREQQDRWEARKSEMQDFNRVEFRLRDLQREVDTNRQLYDIFFIRVKDVSETGGFEEAHARIVDRALTPAGPVKPNRRLALGSGQIVGLLLGSAVAMLLDILDNTIKTPEDVEDKLHAPLLGALPKQILSKTGEFEQFWQNPQSIYAEAIRTIRTGVVLSGLDDPARIIVVTSTVPGEGKSTTALNLGAAMGQMQSTLVIGADLRRPRLAKLCGLTPNHRGLSHYVSGDAALEDCIEHMEALNLHVMPAGLIPPNPLEMISSKRFVDALKSLQDRFDRIIIDSAPVHAVSDALILASYADSVIYLVKADATSATQVQKGIDSLVASNQPLTGVVLNQFDSGKSRSYYGGKHYQYGDYHQQDFPA